MKNLMQLDDYLVFKSAVNWEYRQPQVTEQPLPEVRTSIYKQEEDTTKRAMALQLQYDHLCETGVCHVEFSALGIFVFPEDSSEQNIANAIAKNGLLILYGLIRSDVMHATSSMPCGRVILPTIDVQECIQNMIEEQEAKEKGITPPEGLHSPS